MNLSEKDRKYKLVEVGELVADEELQQYHYAIISARNVGPLNTAELRIFMDNHFEISNKTATPSTIPPSDGALEYITIDFFVEFCILIFAKAYGAPSCPQRTSGLITFGRPAKEKARIQSTSLPLSMWRDKRRIRRALLRFQLYCELFHQPGGGSRSVSDWEERFQEQVLFWLRFEWWEVEEVKCIYQVLVFCLENASNSRSFHSREFLEDKSQSRGLTQLRHFLDDSIAAPAASGESYLQRFLDRQFHGFLQVDPDDYGYLLQSRPPYKLQFCAARVKPEGTYGTLFYQRENSQWVIRRGPAKNRKWMPSPYPGVQLEHFNRGEALQQNAEELSGMIKT